MRSLILAHSGTGQPAPSGRKWAQHVAACSIRTARNWLHDRQQPIDGYLKKPRTDIISVQVSHVRRVGGASGLEAIFNQQSRGLPLPDQIAKQSSLCQGDGSAIHEDPKTETYRRGLPAVAKMFKHMLDSVTLLLDALLLVA